MKGLIYISKPNTWCRNEKCNRGINGSKSFYYSCRYCLRVENWRSFTCCYECYIEWQKQVAEARKQSVPVSLLPDRTDISTEQYNEIMKTSIDEIHKYTLNVELVEYGDSIETIGLITTIDKINEEIKEQEDIPVIDEKPILKSRLKKIGKENKLEADKQVE